MVSLATPSPKIEFPCTFPALETPPLLQHRGIPLPVGRIVVEYCLLPRRVIFLSVDGVLIPIGREYAIPTCTIKDDFSPFDQKAVSNFETLIEKASKVADLAIIILDYPKKAVLSTEGYRDRLFKNHLFSSLIIDSIPFHCDYDQIVDNWAGNNTHLKINGYVVLSFRENMGGKCPRNLVGFDVFAMMTESAVEKGLKILDESTSPGTKKS